MEWLLGFIKQLRRPETEDWPMLKEFKILKKIAVKIKEGREQTEFKGGVCMQGTRKII